MNKYKLKKKIIQSIYLKVSIKFWTIFFEGQFLVLVYIRLHNITNNSNYNENVINNMIV